MCTFNKMFQPIKKRSECFHYETFTSFFPPPNLLPHFYFPFLSHTLLSTPLPFPKTTPIFSPYALFFSSFSAKRIATILSLTDITLPPSVLSFARLCHPLTFVLKTYRIRIAKKYKGFHHFYSHLFIKIYSRPVIAHPYHVQ